MADAELITYLRLQGLDKDIAAADRIEELEKELNISRMASVVMDNTVEELQAKLTKAMEALRFYAPQTVGGITFVGGDDAGKRAAAVLAELEGEE